MDDIRDLTVSDYIRCIDIWYKESRELPINRWNVFMPARRWKWCLDVGRNAIQNGRYGDNIRGLVPLNKC